MRYFLVFLALIVSGAFAISGIAYGFSDENYPPVDSQEFCDWYHEDRSVKKPTYHILKEEIQKNPSTLYFLSKAVDPTYRVTLTEESFPPRIQSVHQYTTNNVTASLEYFFVPCHYPPAPSKFLYQTNAVDVDADTPNFFEKYTSEVSDDIKVTTKRIGNPHTGITNDYIEVSISSSYDEDSREITNGDIMYETIRDSMLFLTHEKWLNQKNQTVYISPKSIEVLTERGYLAEKLGFF